MFKKTKSSLAVTLSVAMLATMVSIPGVASAATSTQLSGKDRYETALKIVEAGWTKSDSAVIARGDDLADALAAAPLAYAKGKAPILLTKTNEISAAVLAELKSLGVKNVYIVGGVGAVSKEVADKLAMEGLTVTRVSGNDRFETSLMIAKEAFATAPADVVIANGLAYADALSISSIAAAKQMPILLVSNSGLSAEQTSYIAGKTVYAVGGEGVLSTSLVTAAKADRISGLDRYKTNAAVLAKFAPDYSKIYLAKGTPANLVDSLAGSALAALGNNPIVLVDGNNMMNAEQMAVVKGKIMATSSTVLLGGTVTQAAGDAVEALKVVDAALAVSSVSAINADQVKVVFTQAVAVGNAETASNYLINNAVPASAELQEDGKTVILTLNTANVLVNGAAAIYVVHSIASDADSTVKSPEFATSQAFTDITAPTVASISSKTNGVTADKVTVTFSEPVSAGTIKIDGAMYSVTAGTTTVIMGLALDVTKTHTLEVVNLSDYAYDGTTTNLNKTAYASQSFNITVDKALPTATVSAYSDKAILVTFSKPVDNNTIDSTIVGSNNITVKDELLANVNVTSIAKSTTVTDGTQYVVTIDSAVKLYNTVASRNLTLLFSANIKDTVGTGNALAAVTKTITLVKDTTKPTVTGITFSKNTDGTLKDVTVTYSKGLKGQTIVATTGLTVVDSNGLLVNAKFADATIAANGTKAVFTANGSGSYDYTPTSILTFSAPTVTDNSETGNTSVAFSKNLNIATSTTVNTFTIVPTIAQLTNKNKITVDFTSAFIVKGGAVAGSATDPSNYSINNKVLPAGTIIYLEAGQHKADITLPDGFITADDAAAIVRVNNVQTTGGLTIVPVVTTANLKENSKPVLTAAVLNVDGTITATTSEALTLANADLAVVVNGVTLDAGTYTSSLITSGSDKGKYLITVNSVDNGGAGIAQFTYIDTDSSATFNGSDIKIATGTVATPAAAGPVNLKASTAVSTITIGTASTTTSADANGNTLVTGATFTIK